MRFNLPASLLLGFAALLPLTSTAHAAPGEAAAILASCGKPDSDTYGTSEATNLPQRTLVYGNTRLEFSPVGDSSSSKRWQFTNAWIGHLPQSANEIARHMACFGQAMQNAENAAAASQTVPTDPSLRLQTRDGVTKRPWFGIAGLWFILFLAGIIAIFAVAVPRRRIIVHRPDLADRPYRKPSLRVGRFRRRPTKKPLTSRL